LITSEALHVPQSISLKDDDSQHTHTNTYNTLRPKMRNIMRIERERERGSSHFLVFPQERETSLQDDRQHHATYMMTEYLHSVQTTVI